MKKILLVATVQSHICQFHSPLAKMLHAHGFEVHVAARNNLAEKNGLKLDFADKVFDVPFERLPFNKKNLTAYRQLKQIIDSGDYVAIHTNTPVGGLVGRLASRKARKNGTKVLYTAHGFHFFKGGPKKSWLIYYPIEKFMCRYTDTLITITNEDYELAKSKFRVNAAFMHGVGANEKFHPVSEEEQLVLRGELGFTPEQKILICTGELNVNKNQKTAILAMREIVKEIPNAVLLLAGNGPTHDQLEALIAENGLQDHVVLLGYHTDLERYVMASDLVVSCSKREGMPLNIIEGMLCKKPVVVSVNRGHRELVWDGVSGYLLNASDVEGFCSKIMELLKNDETSQQFSENGYAFAQFYTAQSVGAELKAIYQNCGIL